MSNPTWSFSQSFSAQFQASRTELESRVEALKSTQPTTDALQTLSVELAKLTKTLSDATGSIPSYDQRQYELQLKGLQTSLEQLRASLPKTKFAFKRKAALPTSSAAASVVPELPSSQRVSAAMSSNLTLSSYSMRYLTAAAISNASQATDLAISDLDKCIVNLLSDASSTFRISALHIRNLTDSVLLLPVIEGSVLLHDLRRCIIVVGCHQFRMHTSTNVDVYLSIPSNPIIEHCSEIRFASYPPVLSASKDATFSEGLSVQDFSHIKSTPSPNWTMLPPEHRNKHWPTDASLSETALLGVINGLVSH
ncbi:tubulin-folding cofactor C [Favolaschia claudopus]|uniref:Tubulin-folding cofactor C n=1 Tax=Favolaschia claudopus TaxID=2862362 RepID=A0AAW0B1N6_9AGAR